MAERRCRECGCTDARACVLMSGDDPIAACAWVEPDLCTACVSRPDVLQDAELRWVHPDDQLALGEAGNR